MKTVPDPRSEDIILMLQLSGMVTKMNKKIKEKEDYVRAQEFEKAVIARDEENAMRMKYEKMQDEFMALTEKYLPDDN